MPSPSSHPPLEPQRLAFGPFLRRAPFLRSCGMAPATIFAFSGPISSGMASKRAFISWLSDGVWARRRSDSMACKCLGSGGEPWRAAAVARQKNRRIAVRLSSGSSGRGSSCSGLLRSCRGSWWSWGLRSSRGVSLRGCEAAVVVRGHLCAAATAATAQSSTGRQTRPK